MKIRRVPQPQVRGGTDLIGGKLKFGCGKAIATVAYRHIPKRRNVNKGIMARKGGDKK